MKKTLFIIAGLAVFANIVNAATYAVTNGAGATANGIADSSITAFVGTSGVVSIGTFADGTDFSLLNSGQDFIDAYDQYGVSGSFLASGIFGNRGIFSLSTAGVAASATFANNPIYLLVGNASTYALATEFLVLESNRDFLAADDDSGTPIDIVFNASSILRWGTAVADIRTTNADASVTPGFATAAPVPEPSVALLGAFGVLGLLRRRR